MANLASPLRAALHYLSTIARVSRSPYARVHPQADRTEQLNFAFRFVSHCPVRHENAPPMKPPNRLHMPSLKVVEAKK
ncbi:hypothetical protein AYO44_11035 [Planctomycetaceae bacterium SCGC AG-212-F19]|nr:hypothetical protein AYO44_11035 [Planctomycetaceae bacterium SCGC AG-212-F19]